MSKQGNSFKDALQNIFAASAILIAFIIAEVLFSQVMANPVNLKVVIPPEEHSKVTFWGPFTKVVRLSILMTIV